jgi:hypothetical protein
MNAEHWFDRLAAPHTRRRNLKWALAGAVATLPLGRVQYVRAAQSDCTRPCLYESQERASSAHGTCDTSNILSIATALLIGPASTPTLIAGAINGQRCHENAMMNQKWQHHACIQPGCSGYTPDPDILCPGCSDVGGTCCPTPSSSLPQGYVCCRCCHDSGDGCKAC